MNTSDSSPPSTEEGNLLAPVTNSTDPAAVDPDDDFGDVELGERQAEACSMDEGCTVCQ
ncbi:MAG: hypothetical protein KDM63_02375 [Verrucomicrobiae bacterium]|nr:hypothetical protein [Verrucomicrobiae bacterium]